MLIEKHNASDEELWQQLHDATMMEVEGQAHLEGPNLDVREYLEDDARNGWTAAWCQLDPNEQFAKTEDKLKQSGR